jgi:Holliday junction resolvasome RuvABC ATP-dependent DNA helicase subunit
MKWIKRILSVIIDHHNGGPVGVSTLAVAVGEEAWDNFGSLRAVSHYAGIP